MSEEQLRLLIIGAHPDDADYAAGGTAALYREAGHVVQMVSMTDGGAGHHLISGAELTHRRRVEAAESAEVIGAVYNVLDNPDGGLLPTLDNRFMLIALIRSFRPDLILTHRPNDYHPDHRYTSQLVQDAAYMVTVPPIVPEVEHLPRDPVIAYLPDDFEKPYPFQPDVVVDVTPVIDKIVDMLHCHTSQFYEWLPYNYGMLDDVPENENDRREWLAEQIKQRLSLRANNYRNRLIESYGEQRGEQAKYAEAFERCEYGSRLDADAQMRLFPFVV